VISAQNAIIVLHLTLAMNAAFVVIVTIVMVVLSALHAIIVKTYV